MPACLSTFVCARADLTERMHANVVSCGPAGFQVTRMFLQSGILALDRRPFLFSFLGVLSHSLSPLPSYQCNSPLSHFTSLSSRGDDAAPSPPAPVSAMRNMCFPSFFPSIFSFFFLLSFSPRAAVVTTTSPSQRQPQRDGHDHDRNHGMVQAATTSFPACSHSHTLTSLLLCSM
ncbi:hypothetical protein F5148DRAFT_212172 [Russula earlei]|uniref:Uncharacterized protein n=1 Tax=Russula earlei TaxID=71964 RepID=A0ACC0U5D2_9AGAM|nr:hypothetical protein F5148DRAFT_212172 [Russula earlei]